MNVAITCIGIIMSLCVMCQHSYIST